MMFKKVFGSIQYGPLGLVFVAGVGCTLACSAAPSDESAADGDADAQLAQSQRASSEVQSFERSRSAVGRAMPRWNEKALRDARPEAHRIAFRSKTMHDLALALTDSDDFESRGTTPSGAELLSNRSRGDVLKAHPQRGSLKFFSNSGFRAPSERDEPATEAELLSQATEHFSRLGLPSDEQGGARLDSIVAVGADAAGTRTQPMKVAQVVEFGRQVSGTEVLDSRARFFYDMDRALVRANVDWPEFRLRAAKEWRGREDAVDEVSGYVAEHTPQHHGLREARSRFVYRYDPEAGVFDPAIVTEITWDEGDAATALQGLTPFSLQVVYRLDEGLVEVD